MANLFSAPGVPTPAPNDVDNVNLNLGEQAAVHSAYAIDPTPAWPVPSTADVIPAGMTAVTDAKQLQAIEGIRDAVVALRDEIFNSLAIQAGGGSYIANELLKVARWLDALGAVEPATPDGP